MDGIVSFLVVISIALSIFKSIQESQRKKAKSAGASSPRRTAERVFAPRPASQRVAATPNRAASLPTKPRAAAPAPVQDSFLDQSAPMTDRTTSIDSTMEHRLIMNASEEGEDPCHEDMLTGPISQEQRGQDALGEGGAAAILQGIIMSEVLSKPVSMRRRKVS